MWHRGLFPQHILIYFWTQSRLSIDNLSISYWAQAIMFLIGSRFLFLRYYFHLIIPVILISRLLRTGQLHLDNYLHVLSPRLLLPNYFTIYLWLALSIVGINFGILLLLQSAGYHRHICNSDWVQPQFLKRSPLLFYKSKTSLISY